MTMKTYCNLLRWCVAGSQRQNCGSALPVHLNTPVEPTKQEKSMLCVCVWCWVVGSDWQVVCSDGGRVEGGGRGFPSPIAQ